MNHQDILTQRSGSRRTRHYQIVDRRHCPVMLDVQLRDGWHYAFSYHRLRLVNLSPDEDSICIDLGEQLLHMTGRDLGILYGAVIDCRLAFVAECPAPHHIEAGEPMISKIETKGEAAPSFG